MLTSLPAADPPFSLEPIVGWRVWALEGADGGLRLRSVTRADHWPPNEAMEAKCYHHVGSTRPSDRCTCGLYAASTPEHLARSGVFANGTVVIGAIAMWGTVIEHARGARSRFAYPARLRLACGPCLAAGYGAVDPVSVIGTSGPLTVVCRRHRLGSHAPARPAEDLQAELLSEYGVELLPIDRVAAPLRTGTPRIAYPAGWFVQTTLTVIVRLVGFVVNAFMAVAALGAVMMFVGWVLSGISHLLEDGSDVRRSSPPAVIQTPSPPDVLIVTPRETEEPYRGGLPAPPTPLHDIAFLCGLGAGIRVDLVPCASADSDLWGFAVRDVPKGARHDCVDGWDAYTRGARYWICWEAFEDQALVHRWANAPNPFTIPEDEGGALDEHR